MKLGLTCTIAVILGCPAWVSAEEAAFERTANDGQVVLQGAPEVPDAVADSLNSFQNVRGASFQDWSAAGDRLYVTTRFGAVSQIHRVDKPGGARHQLTFFSEPVGSTRRRPGSEELIFSMDEGGSEFYQLFALDPRSGKRRRLTDGSSRNSSPSFSDDGRWMAYLSTRRDGRSNDVWLMDLEAPETARILVEAPDGTHWSPGDWSDDGSQLLIENYVSINDSRIHLLEVATGGLTLVAGGGDSPASYLGVDPVFADGGEAIWLASDQKGEFRRLYRRDLASGEMELLTGDLDWDVTGLEISRDGTRAAFVTNEDGLSRLYLMDCASGDYREVTGMPTGVVGRIGFTPDGSRLALTLNGSRSPSDVFTISVEDESEQEGTVERWTSSEVGGLALEELVEPQLVHYESFDGRSIPAFIYRPRGEGPHPVVISIHGGPEGQFRPRFSSTIQMWMAKLGVAVIAPNVRGSSGYGKSYLLLDNGFRREDSVEDIGALLDWIETQPDLDADRVAVYGGSYGGYMVLASLVHYSERLAAAVEIVGISNFVTFLENTQQYRQDLRRPEYGDERDPEMRAHLEKISPNHHAERMTTPLFVAQGQNDPRVPVTESEQIVREVRAAGFDVWYMKALNEGHGFRKKENRDLFQQLTVMFFERHLLGDSEP